MSRLANVTIAPWLSVKGGAKAVSFYADAFGAAELFRMEDSRSVVARMSIEGAEFWLSDESPEHGNFSPQSLGGGTARMILSVKDPDSVFKKAITAGATIVSGVKEEHGWRVGRLLDPFGHQWEIGCELS